ncbi:hypothetical protein Q1695_010490 [Nippostrongylus brasiliensis]|nr:hypothetical protein Q1695_010490 [Nippostrongylus brasiliensis]
MICKGRVGKGFDFRRLSFEVVQQAPWDAPIVPISAVYGSAGVDGKPSSTFCIGVDTRLKPVLLSIDVIVKSMMIALAPRWVNGNRNPHDWLGREGSMNPASKQRKQRQEKDTIHQDEGSRSTGWEPSDLTHDSRKIGGILPLSSSSRETEFSSVEAFSEFASPVDYCLLQILILLYPGVGFDVSTPLRS